jgi:hypothetical protein
MTIGKIYYTKNYARIRLMNPKKFIKNYFRSLKIKKGYVIVAKLKNSKKFKAQAVLLNRKK